MRWNALSFVSFLIKLLATINFKGEINVKDSAPFEVSLRRSSVNSHKSQKRISILSVFVNSVNAQKRIFSFRFCTKTEQCERVLDIYKNG